MALYHAFPCLFPVQRKGAIESEKSVLRGYIWTFIQLFVVNTSQCYPDNSNLTILIQVYFLGVL